MQQQPNVPIPDLFPAPGTSQNPSLADTLSAQMQIGQMPALDFSGGATQQVPQTDQPSLRDYLTAPEHPQYGMSGDNASTLGHLQPQHPAMAGGFNGYGGMQGGMQYGGVPRPSSTDQLLAIGASLLGGGNFNDFAYRAADVLGKQQQGAIQNAQIAQALHRASPAGEMQKQQQEIYQSRMNGDVNRFIKAKAADVNGAIPQEEWEGAWQQIRSQYSPMGLDPGPSPFEIQWNAAKEASPEFRNAQIVQRAKSQYGDGEGEIIGAILSGDEKAVRAATVMNQFAREKALQQRENAKAMKEEINAAQKQVEANRKRDLELYQQTGVVGEQLRKSQSSGMVTPTNDYVQGEAAINAYHDAQAEAATRGIRPQGRLFTNGLPQNVTAKNFSQVIKQIQKMSPADHGDMATFPATISPNDPAINTAISAGHVFEATDPRVMQALAQGRAVLVHTPNGVVVRRPTSSL
jgi:hypothetical protein